MRGHALQNPDSKGRDSFVLGPYFQLAQDPTQPLASFRKKRFFFALTPVFTFFLRPNAANRSILVSQKTPFLRLLRKPQHPFATY
jgi:hypothetical protein